MLIRIIPFNNLLFDLCVLAGGLHSQQADVDPLILCANQGHGMPNVVIPGLMTGITEVQLPIDVRLQNIEETEEAKKKLLETSTMRKYVQMALFTLQLFYMCDLLSTTQGRGQQAPLESGQLEVLQTMPVVYCALR